jgi:hypothetical protein
VLHLGEERLRAKGLVHDDLVQLVHEEQRKDALSVLLTVLDLFVNHKYALLQTVEHLFVDSGLILIDFFLDIEVVVSLVNKQESYDQNIGRNDDHKEEQRIFKQTEILEVDGVANLC